MRETDGRSIVILVCLALILLACASAAMAQGPIEAQAFVGEPFGVGSITLNLPAEMLPEPLGLEGVGVSEKIGPRLLSGHAHAGPGKCPQGVSPRGQPADQRRTRAAGGGRHPAGNPQPSAAHDPLFPLSRQGALGADDPGPAVDPAGRPAAEQSGRAPPLAAGLVARLCRPAAALAAEARLSSAGRNLPGQHARPAIESRRCRGRSRRSRATGSSSGNWARWPGAKASARPSSRTACWA